MSNKKTVYDISCCFFGLTGRQRKLQQQILHENNERESIPSENIAEQVVRDMLKNNKAREIKNNKVIVSIRKSELEDRGGYFSKTTMMFDEEWESRFWIEV